MSSSSSTAAAGGAGSGGPSTASNNNNQAALKAGASKSGNSDPRGQKGETKQDRAKETDVRLSNITAAKSVADAVRTSLGPRGMDKMIQAQNGEVIITNDGATIMSHMEVFHPTAKMLVELSKSQDVEAGDGTTSVVVVCGALLDACLNLLDKGIHPTTISESFQKAATKADEVLVSMGKSVKLSDRDELIKAAITSLASKVVSQNSEILAPLAVDAVLSVVNPERDTNVDLNDIKVTRAVGGTVDDTELVPGLCFNRKASHIAGAPTSMKDAKVGLIQFCLSAPKTDMENNVVVSDYEQMDRILREERNYILDMCKKIKKAGCNVLLVQKSVLRDAVNDLSLHILSKMKIMVVRDVEREDVEFISKTLGCKPVAHVDSFTSDKLGYAEKAEEVNLGNENKVIKITGVKNPGRTVSLLVRGSNHLVVDEAERSIHDALCVVRSLVKRKFMISGGGSPEVEVAVQLNKWSQSLTGADAYCARAFAEAMEIVPYTLAENAGLHPLSIVTELRRRHVEGDRHAGINVKKSCITNMVEENVLQPLLVSTSSISLAAETVRMILKIDDIVMVR